jgi:hypothetical protein
VDGREEGAGTHGAVSSVRPEDSPDDPQTFLPGCLSRPFFATGEACRRNSTANRIVFLGPEASLVHGSQGGVPGPCRLSCPRFGPGCQASHLKCRHRCGPGPSSGRALIPGPLTGLPHAWSLPPSGPASRRDGVTSLDRPAAGPGRLPARRLVGHLRHPARLQARTGGKSRPAAAGLEGRNPPPRPVRWPRSRAGWAREVSCTVLRFQARPRPPDSPTCGPPAGVARHCSWRSRPCCVRSRPAAA